LSIGRTTRDMAAIAAIALICAAASIAPPLNVAHGWSIDVLTALRWEIFGQRHDPASSPAVVVAIDEESYRAAPFKGSPTLTWTNEIGRVLGAIIEGGASVVGFDIVIPTSLEQSKIPFGDGSLGDQVRGFDRDFLRALASASSAGKVVLGEVLLDDQPIRPSQGQRIAVGQQQNIRPLNVYTDRDDAVRRVPLTFPIDGAARLPGIALELASRALKSAPEFAPDGTVTLAGYRIPAEVANTMTVNFEGGADDIPTFSFADLRFCANGNNKEYFRHWFYGKVVIFGSVLDGDDRRLTSKRFATGHEGTRAPRCTTETKPVIVAFRRSSIAGVYIHATAVNNLVRQEAAVELGSLPIFLIAALVALFGATAARMFKPVRAAFVFAVFAVLAVAGAAVIFDHAVIIPIAEPFLAGLAAMGVTVGYRFVVSDKDRRLLTNSFALYLAPDVIDRMLQSNKLPELGGEIRNVTIFFSDIEGFSLIAEKMPAHDLMHLMNEYLSEMTDIIERHGGYVDKYIGDSIIALFGAPADDLNHAANAARAALDCSDRLAELNRDSAAFRDCKLAQRIGINSGEALVGNFGSRKRFNYSVMSDAVNLASRLEGANKFYGTSIIASDTTVANAGHAFAWRELDTVRVKGRTQPLKIYDLLAVSELLTQSQAALSANYAEGLAHWRAGKFDLAAACFGRSAETDKPAAIFRERARDLAAQSPASEWDPIRTLQEK
jgi:adenylate cyclase